MVDSYIMFAFKFWNTTWVNRTVLIIDMEIKYLSKFNENLYHNYVRTLDDFLHLGGIETYIERGNYSTYCM